MEREWAEALIGLLEAQKALVDRLRPLAERQSALIDGGRPMELLDLLAQRQEIVDRLAGSDEALADLMRDLAAHWPLMPEGSRGRVRDLAARIDKEIEEVMRRDQSDGARLAAARDQRRGELAGLDASRQARSAYLAPRAATNRFADRRG